MTSKVCNSCYKWCSFALECVAVLPSSRYNPLFRGATQHVANEDTPTNKDSIVYLESESLKRIPASINTGGCIENLNMDIMVQTSRNLGTKAGKSSPRWLPNERRIIYTQKGSLHVLR